MQCPASPRSAPPSSPGQSRPERLSPSALMLSPSRRFPAAVVPAPLGAESETHSLFRIVGALPSASHLVWFSWVPDLCQSRAQPCDRDLFFFLAPSSLPSASTSRAEPLVGSQARSGQEGVLASLRSSFSGRKRANSSLSQPRRRGSLSTTRRLCGRGGGAKEEDGGARGCRGAPGCRGASASRVSVGVGNGGIWEDHLCTGDVRGAGAVGVRERLWKTRRTWGRLSEELEGTGAWLSGTCQQPGFLTRRNLLGP